MSKNSRRIEELETLLRLEKENHRFTQDRLASVRNNNILLTRENTDMTRERREWNRAAGILEAANRASSAVIRDLTHKHAAERREVVRLKAAAEYWENAFQRKTDRTEAASICGGDVRKAEKLIAWLDDGSETDKGDDESVE
ncbi:hypothetical protein [Curtobacterium phage Reje]|uniref:hypothetical protein n=1 Tax=Curtobacterium phage Reje TaxID=2851069 RepID=UPI0022017902|nr:hypothetical protein QEJ62_gp20 [Curtobacterium phage Reje]QXG07828.1 hypothetical protein [Curtobacterium phage Reje]